MLHSFRQEHGQTILEYALIVAILVVGMAVAITQFGQGIMNAAASAAEQLLSI